MLVKKVAGALGAELSGLDLAAGCDAMQAALVRQALLDHQVIFLRNQDLTPRQFLDFAEIIGEPIEYPFVNGIDGRRRAYPRPTARAWIDDEWLHRDHTGTTGFGEIPTAP